MFMGEHGWGMGYGWFFMIIFWVLIVAAVIFLIAFITRRTGGGGESETALDILKKRYARGEISKDEYERIKEDLKKSS